MNSGADWTTLARQFQASFGATSPISFSQDKLEQVRQQYVDESARLWNEGLQRNPQVKDRRFAGDSWARNPVSAYAAAAYLLNARALSGLVDAVQADDKTRARIRFAVDQYLAATAPSNFMAFNAEAQFKAIQSQGESIAQGVRNLLHDLRQGHVSQTDESLFEVGRNVATTEGAVVYENELFQLLEYKPLTSRVYERPFLLVPPCINKFYILDLQPENSLIRYAVAQGHRTFVVSWRNPDASLAHVGWDDYVEKGAIEAIDAVRDLTGAAQINALGFCVGGTILGTALGVLAARAEAGAGKPAEKAAKNSKTARARRAAAPALPVASATFLTTFLDFSDTGVLDVFIDEAFVKLREMQFGQGGLMPGHDLAATFSFLRPNDLVWNYVVGNYLKGETPPPFDLLYWNSDSTNLPGPMYAWYLRNTYLENNLVKPGHARVCGVPVDLGRIDIPVYIYGSREDHIVPVTGAYASTRHLPGAKRFVMGASGHIAGVINPPAANKRSHWVRDDGQLPSTLGEWLTGATEKPGSWWTDWSAWLRGHAGRQVAAPKRYAAGAAGQGLEPAPGRYVRERADKA
ncbi:MAG: alpha/beta fold hydrolase [Burkholderiales bacterium]|nr:alpha/beta fold hydrolase [Burkholderiales bacterium]